MRLSFPSPLLVLSGHVESTLCSGANGDRKTNKIAAQLTTSRINNPEPYPVDPYSTKCASIHGPTNMRLTFRCLILSVHYACMYTVSNMYRNYIRKVNIEHPR